MNVRISWVQVHQLDLGLCCRPKEFWGNGVRTYVSSKRKIPSTGKILRRGGSNPGRYIKQDSEPNTLPTSYPSPMWFFGAADCDTLGMVLLETTLCCRQCTTLCCRQCTTLCCRQCTTLCCRQCTTLCCRQYTTLCCRQCHTDNIAVDVGAQKDNMAVWGRCSERQHGCVGEMLRKTTWLCWGDAQKDNMAVWGRCSERQHGCVGEMLRKTTLLMREMLRKTTLLMREMLRKTTWLCGGDAQKDNMAVWGRCSERQHYWWGRCSERQHGCVGEMLRKIT